MIEPVVLLVVVSIKKFLKNILVHDIWFMGEGVRT